MCLVFISFDNHPTYKLVIASNRDEFYHRRTAPADFWKEYPHVLAGRDLEAGGSWLGITTSGRLSLVTNYRDLRNIKKQAPSRGALVADFLLSNVSVSEYYDQILPNAPAHNGFNLLFGNIHELLYFSNYKPEAELLSPGIYGLSNHLLNTPWPKVERGKAKFALALESKIIDANRLFDLLYDENRASDDQLPDTGIGIERERALSSMFIKSPDYGTRSSTVLLIDRDNNVRFTERVYDLNTFDYTQNEFNFAIE